MFAGRLVDNPTMKYVFAAAALVAALSATAVSAQSTGSATVVQGSDGTLYLVGQAGRYTLSPTSMTDAQIAALPDLGPISGDLSGTHPNLPSDQPQTLTGQSAMNTKPFSLQGGNYNIDWVATDGLGSSCNQIAYLKSVPAAGVAAFSTLISNDQAAKGQTSHGETQAYAVPAGQFYVASEGDCGWSITVSPQTP